MNPQTIYSFHSINNLSITLRYPAIEDVVQLCTYINTLSQERTFIRFQGETISLEEEQKFVAEKVKAIAEHKACYLVAVHEEKIIGLCGIDQLTLTEKHLGLLGISLSKEYRDQGIGKVLLNKTIQLASTNLPELEIVYLSVYANNDRAINLYASAGFTEYGRLPRGVKTETRYIDHIYMYKSVRGK